VLVELVKQPNASNSRDLCERARYVHHDASLPNHQVNKLFRTPLAATNSILSERKSRSNLIDKKSTCNANHRRGLLVHLVDLIRCVLSLSVDDITFN